MLVKNSNKLISGIFITFSGNCKRALTFYQTCFGGTLHFETFDRELQGFTEKPVISGSLVSDSIVIHGSDLVHNEGRKIGNYLSIFLRCKNTDDRKILFEKIKSGHRGLSYRNYEEQVLIEVTDAFDVTWILGI
ncbi:glyoxalase [Pedobacter panaciterrae]|uniref:Glyoxalase n=1 Tax=Pedobacter panaciterrae TaxID=363849 RepID=A0ABU8NVB2_9SPHI